MIKKNFLKILLIIFILTPNLYSQEINEISEKIVKLTNKEKFSNIYKQIKSKNNFLLGCQDFYNFLTSVNLNELKDEELDPFNFSLTKIDYKINKRVFWKNKQQDYIKALDLAEKIFSYVQQNFEKMSQDKQLAKFLKKVKKLKENLNKSKTKK